MTASFNQKTQISPWVSRIVQPEFLVLALPAAAKLFLHLFAVNGYGIHGDELYYLACSDHLDWGYVDHPALSILLLHFERVLFGDSLLSLRLLPAIAGGLTVLFSGLLARRAGAGQFGQLLAGLCALTAPVYLAVDHYFSMNAFDVLFWTAAVYFLIRVIDSAAPANWIWFGIVMGVGFENKIGVLFLGAGIVGGLLLTRERRLLVRKETWFGAAVACLLMVSYLLWQISHDWATLEWMHNARTQKMAVLSPVDFFAQQILLLGPLTFVVWGSGVIALFFLPSLRRYRSIGWCYLILLLFFIVAGGKPYYLAPIYPVLFGFGSFALERWFSRAWMRTSLAAAIFCGGMLFAPMGMPLLPVATFLKYQDTIGIRPKLGEKSAEGRLPSFFANFFGWDELEAKVDSVFQSLSPDDRAKCGIFCRNYMQAGAIDFYGRKHGLPPALAGHNNYWLWGTHGCTGEVMIILGGSVEELRRTFEDVKEVARFTNEYIQPIHNNIPIFIVRRTKVPLEKVWPKTRFYI